jgi:DNA-binding response OmpR family regulator
MMSDNTILILEDEALIAMDLGEELADRGWTVCDIVGTVEAAEQASQINAPDLAILDVNLRGQYSFDLARAMLARGTTVIFLSGNTAQNLPEDLRDCTFLRKPVSYDALHKTLLAAAAGRPTVKA